MERQDIGCRMFGKLGQGGGKVQRSRKASGLLNEGIGLHERAGTCSNRIPPLPLDKSHIPDARRGVAGAFASLHRQNFTSGRLTRRMIVSVASWWTLVFAKRQMEGAVDRALMSISFTIKHSVWRIRA